MPEHLHAPTKRAWRRAWKLDDAGTAERLPCDLARTLEREAPGVAGAIFEGLYAIRTVVRGPAEGAALRVQRLRCDERLANLPVERCAVRPMLRHDFHLQEARPGGSMHVTHSVQPKRRTPLPGRSRHCGGARWRGTGKTSPASAAGSKFADSPRSFSATAGEGAAQPGGGRVPGHPAGSVTRRASSRKAIGTSACFLVPTPGIEPGTY